MIKDGITNQAYDVSKQIKQAQSERFVIIERSFQDDALGNGSKTDIREQEDNILNRLPVKHIILDCSSINFADSMGIDTIIQVNICHFTRKQNKIFSQNVLCVIDQRKL